MKRMRDEKKTISSQPSPGRPCKLLKRQNLRNWSGMEWDGKIFHPGGGIWWTWWK
jgi:hypothetical protein